MVILPATVSPFPTLNVDALEPVPKVSDLHDELDVIDGWFVPVKFASPMIASVVADGTPFVQLEATFHAVLVVPVQDVCACAATAAMSARGRKRENKSLLPPYPLAIVSAMVMILVFEKSALN